MSLEQAQFPLQLTTVPTLVEDSATPEQLPTSAEDAPPSAVQQTTDPTLDEDSAPPSATPEELPISAKDAQPSAVQQKKTQTPQVCIHSTFICCL